MWKFSPRALVLHRVPPDADAQPQAAPGHHVHLGGLLGDKGGLALSQDHYARGQLNALGDAGQISQHDEGLVEQVGMGVGTIPAWMIGGFGPQHVLDDHEMLVAQGLGGLDVVPYTSRVGSNLRLGENDAQLHAAALLKSMLGPGELAAPASDAQRPVSRLWPNAVNSWAHRGGGMRPREYAVSSRCAHRSYRWFR